MELRVGSAVTISN